MEFFFPFLLIGELLFGVWTGMYLTPHVIIILCLLHLLLIRVGNGKELEGLIFWMPGYLFFAGLVFGGLASVDWASFWKNVSPHLFR